MSESESGYFKDGAWVTQVIPNQQPFYQQTTYSYPDIPTQIGMINSKLFDLEFQLRRIETGIEDLKFELKWKH